MPELIITSDGSHSLRMDDKEESYHSKHGALTESLHVFIQNGLREKLKEQDQASILEIGLGTGLNCLLTCMELFNLESKVDYIALEPFPLEAGLWKQLNYPVLLGKGAKEILSKIHESEFDEEFLLLENVRFEKRKSGLMDFMSDRKFDLIYFDAFAPAVNPELWSETAFRKLYSLMNPGGILVTYCAKGEVKRTMKAAGFKVETLAGPPGKREMTRAVKN